MGRNERANRAVAVVVDELIKAGFLTSEDAGFAIAIKVRDGDCLSVAEQEIFDVDIRPVIDSFQRARR